MHVSFQDTQKKEEGEDEADEEKVNTTATVDDGKCLPILITSDEERTAIPLTNLSSVSEVAVLSCAE